MEENAEFFNRGGYSEFIKPKTYTLSTETAANTGFYWTKDTEYSYEEAMLKRIPKKTQLFQKIQIMRLWTRI